MNFAIFSGGVAVGIAVAWIAAMCLCGSCRDDGRERCAACRRGRSARSLADTIINLGDGED